MDFKALRAAKNKKAQSRIESSGGKVDASDWTPDEKLDADVKTGMRPISRRAFKTGGKVDGDEAKTNLSRKPRGDVGLANTNQRVANEERDGKKHVGGFKNGGIIKKAHGGEMTSSPRPKARPANLDTSGITQEGLDSTARANESGPDGRRSSPRSMPRPMDVDMDAGKVDRDSMIERKRGGKAEKFEGSAKDQMQDKKLADKRKMSMADWEKSKADDKHDEQQSMKGLKSGGRAAKADGGEMLNAISPAARFAKDPKKAVAGGLLAGLKHGGKAEMEEAHEKGCSCKACGGRTARATGGRTKGKTNIVINVMPHNAGGKPEGGIPAPMPPVGGPPPMGGMPPPAPPQHMSLPPGLGAAMAGAAGAPPAPPGAGGMPPMMARKSGGKVYPKMKFGAGSGEGRLEKTEKYGKNA